MAQLQVKVAQMLSKIKGASLDPDLPRVERIDKELQQTLDDIDEDHENVVYGPRPQGVEDVHAVQSALEIDEEVEVNDIDDRIFLPASKAGGQLMQHNISGVLHFLGIDDKFVCGRAVNRLYGQVDVDLNHEWPMCQQCRKTVGEEAINNIIGD